MMYLIFGKYGLSKHIPCAITNPDLHFTNILVDAHWVPDNVNGRIMRRQIAAYADPDAVFVNDYYNNNKPYKVWNETIQPIKDQVESIFNETFNYAHLNLYIDGDDSIGFHYDKGTVENSLIVSVSLGVSRDFQIKPYSDEACSSWPKKGALTVHLCHGDILTMAGPMQKHFKHSVPKRSNRTTVISHGIDNILPDFAKSRINITFRHLPVRSVRCVSDVKHNQK